MRISAGGRHLSRRGRGRRGTHDYFESINTLKQFLSAVLAVVLGR